MEASMGSGTSGRVAFRRVSAGVSKPYIESIAWGNLADTNPTLPAGGLLDDMLKPKPAFVKIQEMREQFHIWQRKV